MRAILILTFLLLMFGLNRARIINENYFENDEYDEYEDEFDENHLDNSNSVEHAVVKKDEFKQIIFNPRKRRQRRRMHRGNYNRLIVSKIKNF